MTEVLVGDAVSSGRVVDLPLSIVLRNPPVEAQHEVAPSVPERHPQGYRESGKLGHVRKPWIVQFGSVEAWLAFRADSPEEIEMKYPELRVILDLPQRLRDDPSRLEALYATADDIDDKWNPLLNGILAERSARLPWTHPVAGTVNWFNADEGVGAISCEETAPDLHFCAARRSTKRSARRQLAMAKASWWANRFLSGPSSSRPMAR